MWIVTRTEMAVRLPENSIRNQTVLEAACGCGEFSLAAAKPASSVICIDLENKRLCPALLQHERIVFHVMDAMRMQFPDRTFDTVVLYNALAHLEPVLDCVLMEC